jgi:hypothetical protein
VGTLLYLADCYQKLGRTASAWATFREAAYAASAAGQNDRERIANDLADKLKPTLSYVSLRVEEPDTQGLEIRRDGQLIRQDLWATPVPVDPGVHRVEAAAPGRLTWNQDAEVPAGPSQLAIEVPALEVDPAASAAAVAPLEAPPEQPPASSPAQGGDPMLDSGGMSGRQQRLYGWIAGVEVAAVIEQQPLDLVLVVESLQPGGDRVRLRGGGSSRQRLGRLEQGGDQDGSKHRILRSPCMVDRIAWPVVAEVDD